MLCSASEAAHLAKLLISGYPNSTLNEPEFYIAQVVAVFVNYDVELVKKAVAPSGIPFEISKFLPTVGEIDRWLSGKKAYVERVSRIKALPLPIRTYVPPAPAAPNLFVAEDVPGYKDAVAFSKVAHARFCKYEKDHVCYDGRVVGGYWVPNSWWEVRHSKTYEQWRDGLNLRVPIQRMNLDEAQKKAALADAASVGKELVGMKLLPETLATMGKENEQHE